MAVYCDVALPVPIDQAFTYSINGDDPVVGGRVLVPFRSERMAGIVLRLHDTPPPVEAKPIDSVLDAEPVLGPELLELAQWISQYYVAPVGETIRAMLPLMAEVRRESSYRITEAGQKILLSGAIQGSSRRSKLAPEARRIEYAALSALASGDSMSERALKAHAGASASLLRGMVRKKWLLREEHATSRSAERTVKVAVLLEGARLPKLNPTQQALLAAIAGAGGRMALAEVAEQKLSLSSLKTLAVKGLLEIHEEPKNASLGIFDPGRRPRFALNEEQSAAVESIDEATAAAKFSAILLFGITGSGKTAVYLAAMRKTLERGRSALLLVPEIGLTPAMMAQLFDAFSGDVALLHSRLTPAERIEQWHRIRRGEARVVVGTRSAIFAPLDNLGLIIVDEEHDTSYKQEETPRYHGRDVAVMRAKLCGAAVVLGSATPSLESWYNAERGKYSLLRIRQRVRGAALPEVELLDMRKDFAETGREDLFSRLMVEEITTAIDRGEQAIVLLNRRGYSAVVLCRSCGEKLECQNCSIALTHHRRVGQGEHPQGQHLECHYCGYRATVPQKCPRCESEYLYFFGAGSQQGEERLQEVFPNARIGRMDRDTVRGRHDMERLLGRLHSGEINLLVGTQMIAKGHDIHGVTLVGVVGIDNALAMPDFRNAERVFQLLTQVSGRAGRGDLPGRVVVQTYHPDAYAIEFAARHDFEGFASRELHFRRLLGYPPFSALSNVLLRGPKLEEVAHWAERLGGWFNEQRNARNLSGVRVLGPATAPVARIKNAFRFHFVLRSAKRDALARVLKEMVIAAEVLGIPRRNLIIDVDAVSLM